MIKIMRPRNKIRIDYVEDAIYIAKSWHDLSYAHIEFMTAILLDKDKMLLEYDILARGNNYNVPFNYRNIMDRGQSLGAKWITLIHNHPFEEYAKLSKSDIEIIDNRESYYNKYDVEINRMVCLGWHEGQYYGADIGIRTYTNRSVNNLAYEYMKNGVKEKQLKKDCIVIADAFSCAKYNTEEKMQKAMGRVAEIAEETKSDPSLYTRTKLDTFFNREKKLYARKNEPVFVQPQVQKQEPVKAEIKKSKIVKEITNPVEQVLNYSEVSEIKSDEAVKRKCKIIELKPS